MPPGRSLLTELASATSEPNQPAFLSSLLKKCTNLWETNLVRDHIARHPLHSRSLLLRNHLVQAYARCGSLELARATFDAIPAKNVFSWSIIIAAYARHGHPRQALHLYDSMEQQPALPKANAFVLSTALAACSALRDLEHGRQIHSRIRQRRGDLGEKLVVLDTALLGMYSSCGCVNKAEEIFREMREKDVVAWNAMITAYAQFGYQSKAILFLRVMLLDAAVLPTPATISATLAGCVDVAAGKDVLSLAALIGVESHPSVAVSLLGMFSRCGGSIADARSVFDRMEEEKRDVVAWNTMISVCAQADAAEAIKLFGSMDVEPDGYTFATVVGVCCDVEHGRRLHSRIDATFASGAAAATSSRLIVDTALVGMYARCGSLPEAVAVFEKMEQRDTVAWNTMIAALADARQFDSALSCYRTMRKNLAVGVNKITLVTLLSSCCRLEHGRHLLVDAMDLDLLDRDASVLGAAIGMLARCGSIGEARAVLLEANFRDVVAWNAMIAAYARSGLWQEALEVYREMEQDGCDPDMFTFTSVLSAAAGAGDLGLGKIIHERMVSSKDPVDVSAGNALFSMYSKCGSLDDARLVFYRIPEKDAISWNSMISACARHGLYKEAVVTYHAMDATPDEATFVSVLAAVAALADIDEGEAIHARVLELGELTPAVESALTSMHAKCGNLHLARSLFEKVADKDIVSWNAMVAANAQHGNGAEVFDLVHRLELEGMSPNGVTLSGVLASCSHAGQLDRGMLYVGWLSQEHGVALESEHYRIVVELLGRCGRLSEAEDVINGMPLEPDPVLWMTLVAACKVHEEVAVADRVAGGLDQDDAASYVLLSNLYSCSL